MLLKASVKSEGLRVLFDDKAMLLPDGTRTEYELFDYIIESQDVLSLFWSGRITVLQKRDASFDVNELTKFIRDTVGKERYYTV